MTPFVASSSRADVRPRANKVRRRVLVAAMAVALFSWITVPVRPAILPQGQTEPKQLEWGQRVESELSDPDDLHVFSVYVPAGQFAQVSIDTHGMLSLAKIPSALKRLTFQASKTEASVHDFDNSPPAFAGFCCLSASLQSGSRKPRPSPATRDYEATASTTEAS